MRVAQGDGKRDGEDDDTFPEVEAELVDEATPAPGAFDADEPSASSEPDVAADDAAETVESGAVDANETEEETTTEERKSTLTPGVMLFLAFSVVALAAFGVWRLQSSAPAPDGPEPTQAVAPETISPAPVNPEPASTDLTAPAQENNETGLAEDKIANIDNGAKPSATLGDPQSADPNADRSFLPPVTQAGAAKLTNSVEVGAKEAMRRFQESNDDVESIDPPSAAPEGLAETSVSGFELESAQGEEVNENTPADALSADNLASEAPLPGSQDTDVAAGSSEGVEAANTAAEADALAADLTALRENFETQKARLEGELNELRDRNAAQQTEIEGLRAELASAIAARDDTVRAANAELSSLRADVEKIRNERAKTTSRQMNAAFALTALSHAIDQGTPYEDELAAVIEFDPSAAGVLGAYAKTGIVTEASLRDRFGAAARAAHAAAGQEKAENWVSGIAARAKSLVNVRPANPVPGDSAGAVLSRAEHALEAGDIGFAVQQLEALSASAKAAMSDWMADARMRAEVEASLASLQSRLVGDTG
ncbi:MAG: mitofilin family membrane protein [Pseudomonadota bacterium]